MVGIPDRLRGERVLAYVVRAPGKDVTPDELLQLCKAQLVKYKVPKKFIFTDEIPTNIAGKKLRRLLRERADSGQKGEE